MIAPAVNGTRAVFGWRLTAILARAVQPYIRQAQQASATTPAAIAEALTAAASPRPLLRAGGIPRRSGG